MDPSTNGFVSSVVLVHLASFDMQLPSTARALGQRALGGISVGIRHGLNQGRRWSLASAGRGYASGTFGAQRLAVLAALLRPGSTFWDLGAHKGFITLAAARLVGSGGRVVAVEPGAVNLSFLRRHLAWNRVENATVIPQAVSERVGTDAFGGPGDSLAFQLGRGTERVDVTTVAHLIEREGLPAPDVMKMDIEGQEAGALRGAGRHLPPGLAVLISVHGPRMYHACRETLDAHGFRVWESAAMAQESKHPDGVWRGDHDLLALGPDRRMEEDAVLKLPLFAGS